MNVFPLIGCVWMVICCSLLTSNATAQPVRLFSFREPHYGLHWLSPDEIGWLTPLEFPRGKERVTFEAWTYRLSTKRIAKRGQLDWSGLHVTLEGDLMMPHAFSPDGQSVLTLQQGSEGFWWQVNSFSRAILKRPAAQPDTFSDRTHAWLPDSSGWLEVSSPFTLRLFSVQGDREPETIALSGLQFAGEVVGVTSDKRAVLWGRSQLLPNGTVGTIPRESQVFTVVNVDLKAKSWSRRILHFEGDVYSVQLSPRQDRLLFTVFHESRPNGLDLFPQDRAQKAEDGKWVSFHIAQRDGAQRRCVGRYFLSYRAPDAKYMGHPAYLRAFWMPDGRGSLSCVRRLSTAWLFPDPMPGLPSQ